MDLDSITRSQIYIIYLLKITSSYEPLTRKENLHIAHTIVHQGIAATVEAHSSKRRSVLLI